MKVFRSLLMLSLLSMGMAGCEDNSAITLGFLGGLSGRATDLGGTARNGMQLAVEEVNAKGGIHGKLVEMIIKDDKQDPETARQATQELVRAGVNAIIGPVTSTIAVSVADIVNDAGILMLGVTVTTNELSDINDQFIRMLSPTSVYADTFARYLFSDRKIHSYAVIYDLGNRAYTESWVSDFSRRFKALGGIETAAETFTSGDTDSLMRSAQKVLAQPCDMVILVANSVDAAMLAKLVREAKPDQALSTSEWAGTERLIELGGRYVEGALVQQNLDRESQDADFQNFREAFVRRFNQEPGFAGMLAYNGTHLVLKSIQEKGPDQTLRDYILDKSVFPGIQGPTRFNKFGDASAKTYVTEIREGRFKVIKQL